MLANPKQVCTDLLRESKAERRELRKSLEARAHSSADIFVQAERSAREKRRMADDKPVSAAAAAEAARRVTQGLTCLRHGEKLKVTGMDSWRSGDPVRAHACFLHPASLHLLLLYMNRVRGKGVSVGGVWQARALATSMAREARLDMLSGLDSPRRSLSAQSSSPSFRRSRISAGLDSSYTSSPRRSPQGPTPTPALPSPSCSDHFVFCPPCRNHTGADLCTN